jgi:CRP-like cAMP-binding protein
MCASRVPIFSPLDHEEMKQVVSLIVQKTYAKNELIFCEGDVNQHLIIVNRGRIKIFGNSADGKEHILYILSTGDFYGSRDLIHETESECSAEAMEDTLVCMIAKQDFRKLLVKFPGISIKIMEILCSRLEKMESLVRKISPKDVDSRIGMMLLELSQKYGRPQCDGTLVELPMSREEMAYYIGVARETVSRKLSLLRDEGVIEIIGNKKILIRNEEALTDCI